MSPRIAHLLRTVHRLADRPEVRPPPVDLNQVRRALLQAVEDCGGLPARRLQSRILEARNQRDLWLMRSDAYRLIALQHCQAVADQRIQRLLHLFEGRSTAPALDLAT